MRNTMFIWICLVYGAANYYVAARVFRLLKLAGLRVGVPVFAIVFALISSTVLLSFFGGKNGLQRFISSAGAIWMGVLLYLFLLTAAADAVLLCVRLAGKSSDAVKLTAEAAVLLLTAVIVVGGAVHAAHIRTVSYSVDSGKGAEPLKLVLVSDIHIGARGIENRLQRMADAISAQEPDLVCIAGDIFNNDFSSVRDPKAAAEALGSIRSKYGVYACLGNHDCGNGFGEMLELLSEAGITLLREDYAVIPGRCVIYGRAERSPIGGTDAVRRRAFDGTGIPEAETLPLIVLDHNPAGCGEYGKAVSLVLCGHTHRGQVFPGSLITKAMYAVDYGSYQAAEDGPTVIVTSGIGYWGPPLKVGCDTELALIELK